MTDHANEIRDVLMWAQAYAPDRLAHRLIDAEESLRALLAGHAAEVEQLRQEHSALTRELATMLGPITPHHGLSHAALWIEKVGGVLIERDEARADAEAAKAAGEMLRQAWRDACDVAIAMSGSSAFSPGGEAHEAWVSWMRPKLHAALAAAQEPPADCEECSGSGFHVGPVCCGNLLDGGCRGDCAVPERVDCQECGGTGKEPPAEGEQAMSARKPIQADGQCTSRFAGCRCHLSAGHAGPHYHDGHKGTFGWGGRITKRYYPGGRPTTGDKR